MDVALFNERTNEPVATKVECHSLLTLPKDPAMLAMRCPTETMRAMFSARST